MLAALLVLQKSAPCQVMSSPIVSSAWAFPARPPQHPHPWRRRGRSPACSYGSVLSLNACAVTNNNGPGITNNNNNGPPIATTAAPNSATVTNTNSNLSSRGGTINNNSESCASSPSAKPGYLQHAVQCQCHHACPVLRKIPVLALASGQNHTSAAPSDQLRCVCM